MRNLADNTRFLEEFFARFTAGNFLGKNLDSHNAADERIVRADNAAEGASANGVENFVTANFHGGPFQKTEESLAVVRIEKGNGG